MNQGRSNRLLTVLPAVAEASAMTSSEAVVDVAVMVPSPRRSSLGRPGQLSIGERPEMRVELPARHPGWTRPRRRLERRAASRPEGGGQIRFPRLPEGIPEEEGTSLGALAHVLVAYHKTVPRHLRDEYVRQLMKFAGEKAGQMLRMHLEQT